PPVALWCAASTWSSATRSRPPGRRAASSPRRRACTCPISRWPIPRTASPRGSGSRSCRTAASCASRSVRESRSMAEKQDKAETKKLKQADAALKAPKGDKPPKGDKAQAKTQKAEPGAGKGEPAEKAPKARKPEERVTPRLRTYFDEVVRKKLAEEFGYRNPMQVP